VTNQNEENVLPPSTEAGVETASEAAQQALEEAKQKAEENWNLFLRARADLDNYRRRAEIDVRKAGDYGIERFARGLIAVADSLEHGILVAESAGDTPYREGMALTLKLFLDTFEKFGITRIQPAVGDLFDPNKHEALSLQESNEAKPNTILVIAQPGFLCQERVLRPARVVVAKAAANLET